MSIWRVSCNLLHCIATSYNYIRIGGVRTRHSTPASLKSMSFSYDLCDSWRRCVQIQIYTVSHLVRIGEFRSVWTSCCSVLPRQGPTHLSNSVNDLPMSYLFLNRQLPSLRPGTRGKETAISQERTRCFLFFVKYAGNERSNKMIN
jgi:hypothetical protein